jgi:hypothetical protein
LIARSTAATNSLKRRFLAFSGQSIGFISTPEGGLRRTYDCAATSLAQSSQAEPTKHNPLPSGSRTMKSRPPQAGFLSFWVKIAPAATYSAIESFHVLCLNESDNESVPVLRTNCEHGLVRKLEMDAGAVARHCAMDRRFPKSRVKRIAKRRSAFRPSPFLLANPRVSIISSIA